MTIEVMHNEHASQESSGIDQILDFRRSCLVALTEEVEQAGTGGVGAQALFEAVRERVAPQYGQDAYRWDSLETDVNYLSVLNRVDVIQGYVTKRDDDWRR